MPLVHKNSSGNCSFDILSDIADAEGVPIDRLPPLYDVLDPESLDTLLESGGVTVTFSYCGYEVTVGRDEGITIIDDPDTDTYAR